MVGLLVWFDGVIACQQITGFFDSAFGGGGGSSASLKDSGGGDGKLVRVTSVYVRTLIVT